MKQTKTVPVLVAKGSDTSTQQTRELIIEEFLEIYIDDELVISTLRTPGEDHALALGYLLADGIISGTGDVVSIVHCGRPESEDYGNIMQVTLQLSGPINISSRHNNIVTSACGTCGRQKLNTLLQHLTPQFSKTLITPSEIYAAAEHLRNNQPLFHKTGGLHAAVIIDDNSNVIASAEDIGRHNAVDKVIGKRLLETAKPVNIGSLLFVSGRGGFEIIQKAISANIPVVASYSAPSQLAVELAQQFNITLIGFVREDTFTVYSGEERLLGRR